MWWVIIHENPIKSSHLESEGKFFLGFGVKFLCFGEIEQGGLAFSISCESLRRRLPNKGEWATWFEGFVHVKQAHLCRRINKNGLEFWWAWRHIHGVWRTPLKILVCIYFYVLSCSFQFDMLNIGCQIFMLLMRIWDLMKYINLENKLK